MKLYYFPLPGRAEAARIMLTISGADFEDVRFDRATWVEKYKALSPTGQAPFLELDDGTTFIAQSDAINRYVGKAGGFYPDDALQAAKVDMLTACLEDVSQSLAPTWSLPDAEKAAARQALFAEGGAAAQKLAIVEKMVAGKMSEFFVSDKLSLADILIFVQISQLCSGFFDGINKETLSSFPELMALRDAVASHPDIVPIYADKADDPVRSAFRPSS